MKIASYYWLGVRHGAPFLLVIVPFGALFGVVATEAGLNLAQVMGFTIVVIAGASQFAAVQLMTENAPTLIVLVTGIAVNLRMAMYSASLTPYLGAAPLWQRAVVAYFMVDQAYAVSIGKYEQDLGMTTAQRMAYYIGVISPICPIWYVATLAGALLGQSIPPEYALDFAVPITFLALVAPSLRTLAHVSAALVSVLAALLLAFLPYNGGLFIASILAMAVGAQVELWSKRRQQT